MYPSLIRFNSSEHSVCKGFPTASFVPDFGVEEQSSCQVGVAFPITRSDIFYWPFLVWIKFGFKYLLMYSKPSDMI